MDCRLAVRQLKASSFYVVGQECVEVGNMLTSIVASEPEVERTSHRPRERFAGAVRAGS
jgi:hypothetical protein